MLLLRKILGSDVIFLKIKLGAANSQKYSPTNITYIQAERVTTFKAHV